MKERIIQVVFFVTFLVCLLTGLASFTHEHDRFDSLSLLLGALANFVSWLTLYRLNKSDKSKLVRFATERVMAVFYILVAALFLILMILSFYFTPEILTPATLFMCAVTQLLGYRVFIRQQRKTARGEA